MANTASPGMAAEFARGWRVVAGGAIGAAFSISALPFYTLGVFVKPIAAATGWSREAIQLGFTIQMFTLLAISWAWGWLVDRHGARRVALASQVGLALALALLPVLAGWLAPSLAGWYLGWALLALIGGGTGQATWTRGVSGWFDAARGTALGLTLFGTGIAAVFAPPLVTSIIATSGWPMGYQLLGLSVVAISLPLVVWLFRDAPVPAGDTSALPGVSRQAALSDRRFWTILVSLSTITFGVAGIIPNLVPLLTDRGLDAATAARYAGISGLAVMAGRIGAGWLIDRIWAPYVAVGFLAMPAAACFLLVGDTLASGPIIALAAVLIGLAAGAEFDLIAYLASRYFGMRNYGFIYGVQIGAVLAATGIAPALFSRVQSVSGSYDPALIAAGTIFITAPLLLLTLGRYPEFGADHG